MRKKSRSFYNKGDGQDSKFAQSAPRRIDGVENRDAEGFSFDAPKLRSPKVDNKVKFIHDDLINEVKEYQDKVLSKEPSFIELNELDLAEDSANKDNTDRLNYNHEQFYKKFEESFVPPKRIIADKEATVSTSNSSDVPEVKESPKKERKSFFKVKRVRYLDNEDSGSAEIESSINAPNLHAETNLDSKAEPSMASVSPVNVSRVDDKTYKPLKENSNQVINQTIVDSYDSSFEHTISPSSDESEILNSSKLENSGASETIATENIDNQSQLPPVYDFAFNDEADDIEDADIDDTYIVPSPLKNLFSRRSKKRKNIDSSDSEFEASSVDSNSTESQSFPVNDNLVNTVDSTSKTDNTNITSLDNLDISKLSDEDLERLSEILEDEVYASKDSETDLKDSNKSTFNTIANEQVDKRKETKEKNLQDEKTYIKSDDLKRKMFEELRRKNSQNSEDSSLTTVSPASVSTTSNNRSVKLDKKKTSELEAKSEANLIDREEKYKENKLSKFFKDFRNELNEPIEADLATDDENRTSPFDFDEVLEPLKNNKLTKFILGKKDNKEDQSETITVNDDKNSNYATSNETKTENEIENEVKSKNSLKNKFLSFRKYLLSNLSKDIEESDSSSLYKDGENDTIFELKKDLEKTESDEIKSDEKEILDNTQLAAPSDEADTLVQEMQERAKFDQLLEEDPEAAAAFIAEKVKKEYKDDLISSAVESPQFRLSKMADRLNSKLKSEIESIRGEINKDKSVAYDKLEEAAIKYLDEENKRLLESSSEDSGDNDSADDLKLMDEIVKNYKQQSEDVENIFSRIRKGEERLSKSNSQFAKRKSIFEDSADKIALENELLDDDTDEDLNQDYLNKASTDSNDYDEDYDSEAQLLDSDDIIDEAADTNNTKEKSDFASKSKEIKTGIKSIFALVHDLIFKAQKLRITPGLSKQSIERLKLRHKLRNESATLLLLYTVVLFIATIITRLLPFSFRNMRNQSIFLYVLAEILRQIFLLLLPAILVTYKLKVPLRRISGKRKLSSSALIISCLTGMPLAIFLTSVKRLFDFMLHNKDAYLNNSYLTYVSSSSVSDLIILIIVSSILCSFSEEIFARGILLTEMLRSGRIYTSIFISSFIYALIAGDRFIIYAMTAGILFAWLRYSLGSIYSSMLAHLAFNATLILLTSRLSIFTSDLNQSTSSIEIFAAILSAVVSLVVLLVLLSYLNGEKQFNDDKEFPRFSREKSWSPVNRKFLISLGFLLLLIVWRGL